MGALLGLLFTWLLRSVVIKFALFTAMYVLVTAVIGYISAKLPTTADLNSALGGWTSGMWYFADLTMWTQFFPGLISAMILRFAIRRIPGLG